MFDFVREPLVDLVEAHRFDVHNEPMQSMEELQSYAARTAGTIFELAVRLLGGEVEPMVFKEAGKRRRSHTCSLNFLGTRRDGNFTCRWTFFDTTERIPKTCSRCARRRNCVLRSRSCGCARVVILRMSSRPKFPRSQSRPFCRWRRCGDGSLIWKSPGTIRSVRRVVSPWRRQWRIWRAAKSFQRIGA